MNTMTAHEGKMWNLIGALGWVESGHDYEAIENLLLDQPDAVITDLRTFADERMGELYNRVDNFEEQTGNRCGNYGGDDSYGDMLAHVVGMGKLAFDTIMADPTRLNEIKFVENFLYSMPHDAPSARVERTLGYHQEQAVNGMAELERITRENTPDTESQLVILDIMERLIFLSQGRLTDACEGFSTSRGDLYRRFYHWGANDRHAMFSNILYDAHRRLIN